MISNKKKYNTVFLSGNFNVLHSGHLRLFNEAKKIGKRLIIGVYGDKFQENKNAIKQNLRLNNLKHILDIRKPQKVIFESDESLVVDPYSAKLIVTLFESLSKRNQFELTRLLNKNKFEFSRAAEFALKQLSPKD